MSTSQTEFMAKESVLAKSLGVSRDVLRVAREGMTEGVDFIKDHRDVLYSLAGVQRLEALMTHQEPGEGENVAGAQAGAADRGDSPDGSLLDTTQKTAPRPAVVTGLPKNRQILLADLNGREVRVRVRDNQKFVAGMEIAVEHLAAMDEDDLFDLVGRCPRAKGVW